MNYSDDNRWVTVKILRNYKLKKVSGEIGFWKILSILFAPNFPTKTVIRSSLVHDVWVLGRNMRHRRASGSYFYMKVVHSRIVTFSSACNCPGQRGRAVFEAFPRRAGIIFIFYMHAPLNAIITSITFQEPVEHSHGEVSLLLSSFVAVQPRTRTHASPSITHTLLKKTGVREFLFCKWPTPPPPFFFNTSHIVSFTIIWDKPGCSEQLGAFTEWTAALNQTRPDHMFPQGEEWATETKPLQLEKRQAADLMWISYLASVPPPRAVQARVCVLFHFIWCQRSATLMG